MSDVQYIHIRNWGRFQHHKNRHVPWIKNYGRQLSDDTYRDLSFHQRGVLHDLRLEYLRTQGRGIRDTTATLTRRLGQRVLRRDLEALNDAGLILFSSRECLEPVYDRIEERREEDPPTPQKKSEQAKLVLLEEAKPKRRRDPIWDALMEAFGIEPAEVTPSARGMYNRVVADLRSIDAKPGEIAARLAVYRRNYPDLKATPAALVKHWPILGNGQRVPTSAAEKYRLQDLRREAQGQAEADDPPFD